MTDPVAAAAVCPLCESSSSRTWRSRCRDYSRNDSGEFLYARCLQCRVAFLVDPPRGGELAAYYPEDYGPYRQTQDEPLRVLGIAEAGEGPVSSLAAAMAETYLNGRCRNLLDFGCGSPRFLDATRALGWKTTGVDFSDLALQRVAAAGHTTAHVEEFLSAPPKNSFDLLHMAHVVEHVERPQEVLAQLMATLRPGGRLHIATPDPTSVGSVIFRRYWFPLEAPRHLVLFPPDTLVALLVGLGAQQVTVVHEHLTKDLARSIEYTAAPLLRRRRSTTAGGHGSKVSNRLAAPLSSVASVLRRTDRYHVFAVRG